MLAFLLPEVRNASEFLMQLALRELSSGSAVHLDRSRHDNSKRCCHGSLQQEHHHLQQQAGTSTSV
jgi:hypothetical protein